MAQLSRFQVEDLTLGMNNVDDPWELRPGESSSLSNVIPTQGGLVISTREGIQALGAGAALSGRIEHLSYWPGQQLILVSHFGNVWSAPSNTGVLTQRRVGTAGDHLHPWSFEVMRELAGGERVFMVNGIDTPQMWDGVTATTVAWPGGTPPAGCTWIKLWKNRTVAGGNAAFPERVYYSDIGNPSLPNPYNFVDLRSGKDNQNDVTSWAEVTGDNLIVFKPGSTWVIYDSNTFANRRLGAVGCPHAFMSVEFRDRVYFMSPMGLYSTNGEEPPVAEPRKLTFLSLETKLLDTKGTRVVMDHFQERILILVPEVDFPPLPSSYKCIAYYPPNTRNNPHKEGTYFSFFLTPKMSAITFIKLGNDPTGNELVLGEIGNGRLWQGFSGATDGGFSFNSAWQTGWIRLLAEERYERLRRVNIRGESAIAIDLSLLTDPNVTTYTTTKLLSGVGPHRIRPESRGRQHKLSIVGFDPWTIYDIELVFRGGKEH